MDRKKTLPFSYSFTLYEQNKYAVSGGEIVNYFCLSRITLFGHILSSLLFPLLPKSSSWYACTWLLALKNTDFQRLVFQKAPYTCTCTETSQTDLTLRKDRVGSTHASHTTAGRGAAFLLPCARRSSAIRLMCDGSECSGIAASKSHEF